MLPKHNGLTSPGSAQKNSGEEVTFITGNAFVFQRTNMHTKIYGSQMRGGVLEWMLEQKKDMSGKTVKSKIKSTVEF